MGDPITPASNQFELLVRSVTDYAIFMLDPRGQVVSWNKGAERIKGYRADEIIGQNFSLFYTPEDRAAGKPQHALRTAAEIGRFEAEGWRQRKDGSRFRTFVVIHSIRDDAEQLIGFAKVTRDITERYEAEQRLAQVRDRLVQAQKLEALGQLTGGLAHDFNNLLTTITAGAELGLRLNDTDRLHALLETILASARRAGTMTRQLLAFSRQQPLEASEVQLPEFLEQVVKLLRPSFRSTIDIELDIADDVRAVHVDASQLELSLLNLAFNARDAMPEGGLLRLSVHNERFDDKLDGLSGEYVAIAVIDGGQGMDDAIRNHALEPFFTTKRFEQAAGLGLGLSQVYGFATQSGGTLSLSSEVGRGTTVTLYLPAALPTDG